MKPHALVALLLSFAMPLPAFAQPHAISELGSAPLVGQIASTAQLQSDVSRDRERFEIAGAQLGISPKEYARFAQRIASRQVIYVTLPRHLAAMSWSSAGRVYVVRDIVIPANTMGWEVDLREGNQLLALFVPARCGNLSIVRKTLPAVAAASTHRRVKVEAIATTPSASAPVAAATAPPAPVTMMPVPPAPTSAPVQSVAQSTPAHHARLWPLLLLIPVVALLVGGSSGVNTTPLHGVVPAAPAPPGVGAPTPPPASCSPAPAQAHLR